MDSRINHFKIFAFTQHTSILHPYTRCYRNKSNNKWLNDPGEMLNKGIEECSVCRSKLASPNSRTYKAYDQNRGHASSNHRALNILLVTGDCVLVGLQVFSIGVGLNEGH